MAEGRLGMAESRRDSAAFLSPGVFIAMHNTRKASSTAEANRPGQSMATAQDRVSSPRGAPGRRVAVLGAGIGGLTAAARLVGQGHQVTVFDRRDGCGGTHNSQRIGPYTFDVGSVFFTAESPMFTQFEGTLAMCTEVRRRQQRLAPDGAIRHYPFEPGELRRWPLHVQAAAAASLVRHRLSRRAPAHAEDACLKALGAVMYERSGLRTYIERFHDLPAPEIGTLFYDTRMQFVDQAASWQKVLETYWRGLRRKPYRKSPPRPFIVRPEGGFEILYNEIQRQLEAASVVFRLGEAINAIDHEADGFELGLGEGRFTCDDVIGAMPLDSLLRMTLGHESGLESGDLLTLFVSHEGPRAFDGNVLFNFHPAGRWKRLTMYSDLYGQRDGRDYFSVEVPLAPHRDRPEPEEVYSGFAAHLREQGALTGDMRLEGHCITKDAYPIYRKDTLWRQVVAIDLVSGFGIVPVGRQGRFDYLPTAAQVVRKTNAQLAQADM
jgi:protoporphyrinogen oxidase